VALVLGLFPPCILPRVQRKALYVVCFLCLISLHPTVSRMSGSVAVCCFKSVSGVCFWCLLDCSLMGLEACLLTTMTGDYPPLTGDGRGFLIVACTCVPLAIYGCGRVAMVQACCLITNMQAPCACTPSRSMASLLVCVGFKFKVRHWVRWVWYVSSN
jgi:hypothetical protein